MGIFDVFKTKVTEAADKVGDVAGDLKDKAEDMIGHGDKAENASAPEAATARDAMPDAMKDTAGDIHSGVEDMVSEGAPAMEAETASAAPTPDGAGGMMGTIKDNAASGADKAGELADNATGNKFTDQINTGVDKAKGMLGKG